MQTSSASPVQLFAVTAAGPRALAVPASARSFHDVLDGAPLGVYSALRTFHHDRFLWLDAHLDRTDRSMELLGWTDRLDRPALRRTLREAAADYPLPDARVRFDVLARADERLGTDSRLLVALSPFKPVPQRFLREGVRVEVAKGLARRRPLVKTADFILERRPYPLEKQEAYEHLILDAEERILEGSSSNFHGVQGGELVTGGGGALEGITQRIVIHLAGRLGLRVRRERVGLDEVARLDEAFLTSSTRGLVPIVDVAGSPVGAGRPGPTTERLRAAYEEFAERECAPAA